MRTRLPNDVQRGGQLIRDNKDGIVEWLLKQSLGDFENNIIDSTWVWALRKRPQF